MSLFWLRRPHVPLLVLLLLMVAAFPWVEESGAGRCLLSAFAFAGIVFSLWRVEKTRRDLWVSTASGLVALVVEIAFEAGAPPATALVYIAAQGVFYTSAAAIMSRYMLSDAHATVDELFAAASAFLLIAMAWASAYWVIHYLQPGAFTIAHPARPGQISWFEFVYFSMTTLSTTGYGDMAPASGGARAAVVIEQFVGVMYVALVISRLAGFTGQRGGKD